LKYWGSSVTVVSDYKLEDRGSILSRGKGFFSSSLCVQTGSGAHPASCKMGIEGPISGLKLGRGVTLTTLPHLVSRSRMIRSYTSCLPLAPAWRSGTSLLLLYFTTLNKKCCSLPIPLATHKYTFSSVCYHLPAYVASTSVWA
jgi:hypothetical protein